MAISVFVFNSVHVFVCSFVLPVVKVPSKLVFTQKMPSSEKQQPIRPPPPAHVREIGEAVARYNFNADTNVELSLRKVLLHVFTYIKTCIQSFSTFMITLVKEYTVLCLPIIRASPCRAVAFTYCLIRLKLLLGEQQRMHAGFCA